MAREANKKLYVIMALLAVAKVPDLARAPRGDRAMTATGDHPPSTRGSRRSPTRDLPLAVEILREAIRIPADHVDRPLEQGGDPLCGLSNHEGPRLAVPARARWSRSARVLHPDDLGFDAFGNLEWTLEDPNDGMPRAHKRVLYLDGHCDTVRALRGVWHEKTGGLDPVRRPRGRARRSTAATCAASSATCRRTRSGSTWCSAAAPPTSSAAWCRRSWPRASWSSSRGEGALRGVIVRGYVTVAEEDNDGGGPLYITRTAAAGRAARTWSRTW